MLLVIKIMKIKKKIKIIKNIEQKVKEKKIKKKIII